MTIESIIKSLGGELLVAHLCAVHQNSVSYWIKTSQIPIIYWELIIKASKHKITVNDLYLASKKNFKK